MNRHTAAILALGSAIFLGGCATVNPAASTTTPTPVHRTPTPAATPSTPPLPPGPFAVVVTNAQRSGTTYDVLIIDTSGRVVARTQAQLPHLKANQTIDLPLVSASASRAFYLDGDTDIRSLSVDGTTALVKSVAAGSNAAVAFAVRPDEQRIAIVAISEKSDPTKDTGHGYVEDLTDAANHVDLFNNVGSFALRWPVGWHNGNVVDAIARGNSYGYGEGPAVRPVASYHTADAASGSRLAALCETTDTSSAGGDYYYVEGGPSAGGIACEESQGGATYTDELLAVDWTGTEHKFVEKVTPDCCTSDPSVQLRQCYLSPDATQMACVANANQSLTFVHSNGSTNDSGRRYTVLGWIDGGHLLVDVDAGTLAVMSPSGGGVLTLAISDADKMAFGSALPGSL